MKKRVSLYLSFILAVVIFLAGKEIPAWELQIGASVGGHYLDFSMLDYNSALQGAIDQAVQSRSLDVEVKPQEFTGENGFDYGGYIGLKLGFMYFGIRATHSDLYMKAKDNPQTSYDESQVGFDMGITVLQGEVRFILPLWIFQPFAGIGLGYAYLDTTAKVPGATQDDQEGKGNASSNGFDGSAMIGLDINIGKWFAIGAMANFSFIFFSNDAGSSWGFGTEYLLRLTLRI